MPGIRAHARRAAITIVATLAVATTAATAAHAAPPRVDGLRTQDMQAPVGLDVPNPTLSWRTTSDRRGTAQSAYRVRVASSAAKLAAGDADLWDSGRVAGAQSADVAYGGRPLASRDQAFWQVQVWDATGDASSWSAPATFEMGLLRDDDWAGGWIQNADWASDDAEPVVVKTGEQDSRYVRVDVTKLGLPVDEGGSVGLASRVQLSEAEVVDSASGTNQAAEAAVTASETYTAGGWSPGGLTDGIRNTNGPTKGYTSLERKSRDVSPSIWVQIDLGAVKHFDEVRLYPRTDTKTADGQAPNFPTSYTVQTADAPTGPTATVATVADGPAPPTTQHDGLPLFAKDFDVAKPVRSARLYVAGLGVYEATVNGRPVSDDVLEPGYSDVAQRVGYGTYDVTKLVQRGANAVGVSLGKGMYYADSPAGGRYAKFNVVAGPPKLIGQLEVTYADGSRQVVATDDSWKTTQGPVTEANWWGGEDYDATRLAPDWDRPSADRAAWDAAEATTAPAPTTKLTGRDAPPLRITERVTPKSVTKVGDDYVFDMGTNIAGWPELRIPAGARGSVVRMAPGEQLNPDGSVSQQSTHGPIFDRYTKGTDGAETYRPRFVYHGFRYLQVSGLAQAPTAADLTGLVIRADNEAVGSFDASNPLLNGIHKIIDRAVQGNMYSVLTDCPTREKLGWLEETQLVFGSVARNYDVAAYGRSMVRNIAQAQTADGLVPDISPEYVVFDGGFRDDPNWGGSIVLLPLRMYDAYGDTQTLRTSWDAMVRYVDYLKGKTTGDLLTDESYGLGDWFAFDTSTPMSLAANFGYHAAVAGLARIATVLGRTADAAKYEALSTRIERAVHATYYDPDRHTYGSGSQASDAFALDMGAVPADLKAGVLDHLIASIRKNGNHVSVGEVALPSLFRVLSDSGHDDVVYDIASQTTSPSYGYQVVHGATSLTEAWDGPTKTEGESSQNHFMLGAIDEWFTSGLAGIKQAAGSTGYDRVVVDPAVVGDLTHVRGSYRSLHGTISSEWTKESDGGLWLRVAVPVGSTAEVHVPTAAGQRVGEDGHVLEGRDGVTSVDVRGDETVVTVGSGSYRFRASTRALAPNAPGPGGPGPGGPSGPGPGAPGGPGGPGHGKPGPPIRLRATGNARASTLLRRGLLARIGVAGGGRIGVTLTRGRTTLASAARTVRRAGTYRVRIRLGAAGRRAVRALRPGRTTTLELTTRIRVDGRSRVAKQTVRVKS